VPGSSENRSNLLKDWRLQVYRRYQKEKKSWGVSILLHRNPRELWGGEGRRDRRAPWVYERKAEV
jgi:hypothetical protein